MVATDVPDQDALVPANPPRILELTPLCAILPAAPTTNSEASAALHMTCPFTLATTALPVDGAGCPFLVRHSQGLPLEHEGVVDGDVGQVVSVVGVVVDGLCRVM